jgi:hypothetical protein
LVHRQARFHAKRFENSVIAHLITHFGMGTILGALFALALVISNRQLSHLIASASSPSTSMALFVGFFSFVFAVGGKPINAAQSRCRRPRSSSGATNPDARFWHKADFAMRWINNRFEG